MEDKEYCDGIPAHYLKNNKIVWYEILLKDGQKKIAYPDPEVREEINIDWILITKKKVNDSEILGWKILGEKNVQSYCN